MKCDSALVKKPKPKQKSSPPPPAKSAPPPKTNKPSKNTLGLMVIVEEEPGKESY